MDSNSRDGDLAGAEGPVAEPDVGVVLRAERLAVARERVAVQRVRFRKRVVTTTRTVEVPVRVEQLVVTHEPLTGEPPTHGNHADGTPTGETPTGETLTGGLSSGEELVIVLHEEVPEVSVRVVPVEKVTVRVHTVAGEQTVTADLRTEVVDVVEVEQ